MGWDSNLESKAFKNTCGLVKKMGDQLIKKENKVKEKKDKRFF